MSGTVDSVCDKKKILKHQFTVRNRAFNSLAIIYEATTNNGAKGFQAKERTTYIITL